LCLVNDINPESHRKIDLIWRQLCLLKSIASGFKQEFRVGGETAGRSAGDIVPTKVVFGASFEKVSLAHKQLKSNRHNRVNLACATPELRAFTDMIYRLDEGIVRLLSTTCNVLDSREA
jgi:hypothetical protein